LAARPRGRPRPRPPSAPPLLLASTARPRPCARLRCGGAVRPPCPPWWRGSPARGSARPCARPARRGGVARPWRPELGRGARCVPGVLRRPTLAAGTRPWPRHGFSAVHSPARRGLLAWLAHDVAVWRAPGVPARLRQPARLARGGLFRSLVCAAVVRGLVCSLA
jgi:hypothetical protein